MGIDAYIARLRAAVTSQQPTLLPLFETMAAESAFAREWLEPDLASLPSGATLLEVGGGTFILGCLLAEEGFYVTSIEPVGDGFGEFRKLAEIVLSTATARPHVTVVRGEDFITDRAFDFAFSVNVMEHVDDPAQVTARVVASLKPGASYRFFCPNYLFPYEPHFNVPTLLNKALTYRIFEKKIRNHPMHDPLGTWASLNWITVPQVFGIAKALGLPMTCNRNLLPDLFERAVRDTQFASRRSPAVIRLIRTLVRFRIHRLGAIVPASLQPAMDVRLRRA